MDNIEINSKILERYCEIFVNYISEKDHKPFCDFNDPHSYIYKEENYKKEIYDEVHPFLYNDNKWTVDDIGTGKILEKVKKTVHKNKNNLVFWIQKDDFNKLKQDKELESVLYNLYKNKGDDKNAFVYLLKHLSYQFTAYLFFIKEKRKYLPISQQRFDEIFEQLGIQFKTMNNGSWENYIEFLEIIKQAHKTLKKFISSAELLDAHSFLWVIWQEEFKKYYLKNK
jgi:hypothetical protein